MPKKKKPGRGGVRPGAGRPAFELAKRKVRVYCTVLPRVRTRLWEESQQSDTTPSELMCAILTKALDNQTFLDRIRREL